VADDRRMRWESPDIAESGRGGSAGPPDDAEAAAASPASEPMWEAAAAAVEGAGEALEGRVNDVPVREHTTPPAANVDVRESPIALAGRAGRHCAGSPRVGECRRSSPTAAAGRLAAGEAEPGRPILPTDCGRARGAARVRGATTMTASARAAGGGPSRMRAHTRTHARAHARTRMHASMLTHARSCRQARTHTAHTCTHTRTHARTHAHTRARTFTHIHAPDELTASGRGSNILPTTASRRASPYLQLGVLGKADSRRCRLQFANENEPTWEPVSVEREWASLGIGRSGIGRSGMGLSGNGPKWGSHLIVAL
jgi:hypothetical protein